MQTPLKALRRIPKPKLLRSNPYRKLSIVGGSDPNNTIDDEDLHVSYRRYQTPRYRDVSDDDELSEHITKRLAEIRDKALEKYRETWG